MSVWHDPKGRLVVDSTGRAVRRAVPGHSGYVYGDAAGWTNEYDSTSCFHCGGTIPILYGRQNGIFVVPFSKRHSCRRARATR